MPVYYERLTTNDKSISRRRSGFSLIEIVLFLFLVIALISILFATSGTYIHSRNSSLYSIATKIATKRIETLRNTAFASLPANGSSTFTDADLSKLPNPTPTQTLANYQSSSEIRQVTIEITWTENNQQREIEMETLIGENGL